MSLRTTSQNRVSNFTFTNSRTGGGGAGTGSVTITSIVVADSGFNNLDDSAVNTSNSYIKIIGTGFNSSANIFVSGSQVSSANISYVNSTEIRVTLPSLSLGNTNIFVFNPDNSGAIWAPGLRVSGFPDFTQTSYTSSTPLEVSVQLLATGDAPLTYTLQAGSSLPSGCLLSSSGLITGTTVDGVYQFTVIVTDAQLQSFQFQITLTIQSTDAYFNRTVLAINADANTFVTDASSNNFAITVNGDTKPSAFSPYNTNWSNEFDGSGDSLSVPAGNAFAYGTGDFTIEGWFYQLTSLAYGATLFAQTVSGTNYILITAGANSATPTNNLVFHFNVSGAATFLTSTNQYQLNQWNHFAVVRLAGVAYLYINGVANGSAACTQDFSNTTYNPTIGTYSHSGIQYFTGYISNIRVVKGTAVYTSAFTPSTTPLTAIVNTSLLTCQSNRFRDNSTNAFAITKAGDTKVKAFGPFTETDTTTGSGYFDGTGDYLTLPSNAALNLGTGAFSVEFWVYITSLAENPSFINTNGTLIFYEVTGSNRGLCAFANSAAQLTSSTTALPLNAWNHVVVCRNSSGNLSSFVNGIRLATVASNTSTFDFSGGIVNRYFPSSSGHLFGYTSSLRIVKGSTPYDPTQSTLTVPSASLTAIANTSLLTLQGRRALNNHTFIDGSENSLVVTKAGNSTQGSFSPFSPAGWSNYFDGSGDYLTTSSTTLLDVTSSTQSFTIEAWIYPTSIAASGPQNYRFTSILSKGVVYLSFGYTSTGILRWYTYSGVENYINSASGVINANQWQHVAIVSNAGAITLYVNGTSVATGTLVAPNGGTGVSPKIGHADTAAAADALIGYISNFRTTTTAVYTSNFTPPTAALTAIANTSLLTCQSNRFIDNSTNNFTITKNGDTKVVNFSPFAPTAVYSPETHGASAYFDGTGDYLTLASNVLPDISGVFTYECWVYLINGAAAQIFGCWNNNTGGWGLFVSDNTSAFNGRSIVWYFGNYGSNESYRGVNSVAMTNNAWNHIAVVRNASNVWAFYVNGIERGTTTFGSGISWLENRNFTDGNPVGIGQSNATPAQCYISDARLVIGNAVYTANFTPPTAPLTKIGGTNLLLNFNSGGIIDSTSRNVLETVGGAGITTSTRKYGTGSMYFDGVDDNIVIPYDEKFSLGTTDFTVEGWFNFSNISTNFRVLITLGDGANGSGPIYNGWNLGYMGSDGSNQIRFQRYDGTDYGYTTSGATILANTWYHIAVARSNSVLKIFVDGVSYHSSTVTTSFNAVNTNPLRIALGYYGPAAGYGGPRYWNGYIDDIRITKFARYTANFTPPTATFLAQ